MLMGINGNLQKKIRANIKDKIIILTICLLLYPFSAVIGFSDNGSWYGHFVYMFGHANIFHFIINVSVLFSLQNKIRIYPSYFISVLASFLPMYVQEPTVGLSAFLFSSMGQMWGRTGLWKEALKKAMPFIICTMAVPNINGLLHFWCFVLGYIVAYCINNIKNR